MIKKGVKPTWTRFMSKDKGARVRADGEKKQTRPDHFTALQDSLAQWARDEQLANHELSADDLYAEYVVRLEEEQDRMGNQAEPLTQKDKKW